MVINKTCRTKAFFSDGRVLVRTVVTCKKVLGGAYSTLLVEDLSCFIMVKSWQFRMKMRISTVGLMYLKQKTTKIVQSLICQIAILPFIEFVHYDICS